MLLGGALITERVFAFIALTNPYLPTDSAKKMAELIAQHTGQTIERTEEDADRDRWFTPDEAKEYGFIDHVISHQGDVKKGKA